MDRKNKSTLINSRLNANSEHRHHGRQSRGMAKTTLTLCMLVITATLAACGTSSNSINPTSASPSTGASQPLATAIPAATSAPAATATPASSSVSNATAVSTQLDPCQLIDSQEASKLVGTTFGQGKEVTTHDNLKICTYGGQSTNILTVEVVQAPDVATAQADKAQFLADLQSSMQELTSDGLKVTQLPNFADGAVTANANVSSGGISMSGNAFGFLKGTVFFGFSDVAIGGTAPTDAAMQAEANSVLAMLP